MVAAFAQVDDQVHVERAARAEEDGRLAGCRRGPSEAIMTSAFSSVPVFRHKLLEAGRPTSFAGFDKSPSG
jgi:hypothetical protein